MKKTNLSTTFRNVYGKRKIKNLEKDLIRLGEKYDVSWCSKRGDHDIANPKTLFRDVNEKKYIFQYDI